MPVRISRSNKPHLVRAVGSTAKLRPTQGTGPAGPPGPGASNADIAGYVTAQGPTRAAVDSAIAEGQRGAADRIRRAARVARDFNSLDRGVMATPPTVTAATTNPDASLSLTYYFTVGNNANLYAFRGGTPSIYTSIYYRFPTVTVTSGGNVTATLQANAWAVEFYCDAPKVILFMANSVSPNGMQVEVDGQAISATRTNFPATSGGCYVLLDFTTAGGAKVRRFRVEGDQASGMRGVQVAPTYTVWRPSDADPITAAVVGDSVTAQTGVSLPNGGWAAGLGKLLGWSDVREIALGSTGWTTPGSWGAGSEIAGTRRINDVLAANPNILMLTGSSNDSAATASAITSAVLAGLQAYRAALPDVPIVLGGVFPGATGPSAPTTANENAVKAAFDQFADANAWWVPISTDPTGAWVTGTGKAGATTGSGNADRYIISDGIHPGQAGHDYYARRWATAMRTNVLPYL